AQRCWIQGLIAKLAVACPYACPFAFRALAAIAFKGLCDSCELALFIAQCATCGADLPLLLSIADPYPGSYGSNRSVWIFNERRDESHLWVYVLIKKWPGKSGQRTDAVGVWSRLRA